jgi:hypothetical protein
LWKGADLKLNRLKDQQYKEREYNDASPMLLPYV